MQVRDGKRFLGALVTWVALAALVPTLATASSISGTVTDEGTGVGIAGIEVCAGPFPTYDVACAKTGSGGTYLVDGLPAGSYEVRFAAWPLELNYVKEWYGGDQIYPGDLVTVGAAEARTGIDAELEAGGVIRGTATDAITDGPASGVWVWIDAISPVFYGIGFRAGADGKFEANDLPTGEYRVQFDGENDVNYLRRFYDETDYIGTATKIPVTAGSTVSGIDAELYPGGQIFGAVTEAGSGSPLGGVEVCLWRPGTPPEYTERCTRTDSSGDYAIRSLPAGTFGVVFSEEGSAWTYDDFGEQWWPGVASSAEAIPLTIAPPEEITGIDAQLVDLWPDTPVVPGTEGGPGAGDQSGAGGGGAITLSPPPSVRKPLPKCKKGFHRKLVKGKKRCVRKHRKHQQRRKGDSAGSGVRTLR